jgi:hypothetical protein
MQDMRWLPLVFLPALAHADPGRLLSDDTFTVPPAGTWLVDAGVITGLPAALPAGMSTGLGAGITRTCGCLFSYGARISWSTVDETSESWLVTQQDLRLRLTGAIRHDAGRGSIALRLGAGGTLVREIRDRQQSSRLGDPIETHALRMLPAAELEAVVSLHIAGSWAVVISGGPSIDYDGGFRGGWISELGVGWQP